MSDSEETSMSEKLLKLQYELIDTKLGNLAQNINTLATDLKKVLEDHEGRLRKSAENDASTAQLISTMQLGQENIKNEVQILRMEMERRFEAAETFSREHTRLELSMWQSVALELAKYAVFGASGGGVLVAIIKLFGITL